MHDFWHSLAALKIDTAVAGAAGGVVRWMTLREDLLSGAISIIVGAISAHYLGEPAMGVIEAGLKWIGAKGTVTPATAGFVVGLGGIGVSGFILDVIKALRAKKAGG